MKKVLSLVLALTLLFSLTACENSELNDEKQNETDYMTTVCNKDFVDEFMSIIGDIKGESLYSGYTLNAEHCYNVTPTAVSNETDFKVFKFSDSCASFVLIDGEVYELCTSFGGYGFVNAVPWDYDEDGNIDLLVASSSGSGVHSSAISVFNTRTKESTVLHVAPSVYDDSTGSTPIIDLFIATTSPSQDSQNLPIYYSVYSAKVEVNDGNYADLSYVATDLVGTVTVENGVPIFKPYED